MILNNHPLSYFEDKSQYPMLSLNSSILLGRKTLILKKYLKKERLALKNDSSLLFDSKMLPGEHIERTYSSLA